MSSQEDFLKLDSHFCFSLYTSSRAMSRLYRPLLDELNLTYPQYLVLLVLWEHEMSSIKELGELLDLDSGTLTPLLKRMEAANLVKKHRSPEDERIVVVRITEEGQSLKERASGIPKTLLDKMDMSMEELGELNATIKKFQQRMSRCKD